LIEVGGDKIDAPRYTFEVGIEYGLCDPNEESNVDEDIESRKSVDDSFYKDIK
jgi:hypothetical protein